MNSHDRYRVVMTINRRIVEHVSLEYSKLIYYYGIKMNNNDNHYSKMLSSLLSLMSKSPSSPLHTLPNKEVNDKIINTWSFNFTKEY